MKLVASPVQLVAIPVKVACYSGGFPGLWPHACESTGRRIDDGTPKLRLTSSLKSWLFGNVNW